MDVPAGHPPADSLLAHRQFVRFWCGRVCAVFAYQMLSVAVGWQVYALTGSALALGLVGLAQFLPSVALLLVVGHVADRYDRRRVVRICQMIEALAVATLAGLTLADQVTEHVIFGLVIVIGAARAFEFPTLQTILPGVVSERMLPRAIAASSTAGQLGVVLGPAIGGFLYAAGPLWAYGLCTTLYLVASVLIGGLRVLRRAPATDTDAARSIFAGLAFIRRRKELLGAITLDMFAVLLGGATALLPVYARDILHTGPWGLGLLRSAPAVGALATALWLARHPLRRHAGRKMFIAVAVFGVATIAFGLSTSFPLSFAALIVLGASDMVGVVVRQSLFQLGTPDAMRGRVSAVNAMFIGASNQLGEFESGVTAAWWGAVPAVVVGGIGTLLVVALFVRMFPALAQVDSLVSVKQEPEERSG